MEGTVETVKESLKEEIQRIDDERILWIIHDFINALITK